MVELHSSNFRVITTNYLGVRIIRKFTVMLLNQPAFNTAQNVFSELTEIEFTLIHVDEINYFTNNSFERHCIEYKRQSLINL